MGITEFCLLVIFIFLSFASSSSSSSFHNTLNSSEVMQKSSKMETKEDINESKIEESSRHGGSGSGSSGNGHGGEQGNNGGSAIIPVYAAGAAHANDRGHRSRHGSNSNLNRIQFPTLFIITSSIILSYFYVC